MAEHGDRLSYRNVETLQKMKHDEDDIRQSCHEQSVVKKDGRFNRIENACNQCRREGEGKWGKLPGPRSVEGAPPSLGGEAACRGPVSERSFPRAPNWFSTGLNAHNS